MNKNFVYTKGKILFSMLLITFLLVSINEVDVASSFPATYFFVDPPEVKDVMPEDTFLVTINVTEAPETYAWEIYVSWDPDLLELDSVAEGDFLHRMQAYITTFLFFPSLVEANVEGEIMIGCSLQGDVPWATGDGWLMSLDFTVEAEGSCILDLFATRLYDYILVGSPGFTYYPNQDCFFYNEPFHNIAITSVTRAQAAELVTINVTVTNEGNYTETSETFNVTVYADTEVYKYTYDITDRLIKNTTVVGDEITVGTQTVTDDLALGANTTLTFTWDMTEAVGGTYTISAEAMGDDDTRDNLFIDGAVSVAVHDIAVTNVVASPTEVTVGDNVTIDVTVENEGYFNETDISVTVYYDDTVIETETGIFLGSGTSTTLTFTWNTTDVADGTYTIKAEASVVPDETDTDDNTRTDGIVEVRGEAAAPDILPYVAVGIVIIIAAAIAIYVIKFRKPA